MKVVVTAVIKNPKRDKFLIVKRSPSSSIHPSKWSFPGGICKKGEDLITALKREIKEETNLNVNEGFKQIAEYEYVRPKGEITFGACFSCTATTEAVTIGREITACKWIFPQELIAYDHIPELDNEVKKAFEEK